MEYNSQREKLLLPEFGRNIQSMVNYTLTIQDRAERTRASRTIIQIMAQNTPSLNKDQEDFYHMLWDHLHVIAKFSLEVDSPYNKPTPEDLVKEKKKLQYPNKRIRYKHYGKNVEYFIAKARKCTDPEMKDKFIESLANMMKKAYLSWNRDSVNDELIKDHLAEMSEGELIVTDKHKISSTSDILGVTVQRPKNKFQQKKFHKNNNNRNNPSNNNRNFKGNNNNNFKKKNF
jgi:hypothetical protein